MKALDAISSGLVYDAMYGAGQAIVKRLLPKSTILHGDHNPGFEGRAPEPILKNLPEIGPLIASSPKNLCGLATDGDADRIGWFDENGQFVDSHHLILLLIEYLTTFKGYSGKVVKSFSVSDKVQKLCDLKGLEAITTKIGFKYICEYMVTDDVLIGAEESGGIAIKGHIPERDGVWMGLVLMEYMAKTGKSVSELIQDMYAKVGSFAVERYDLHLTNELKESIIENCKSRSYAKFGLYDVVGVEDVDGYKFRLSNGSWVMIRPSGTEPVLRVYAESTDSAASFAILDATKSTILT
jgi:phosphomannomutase